MKHKTVASILGLTLLFGSLLPTSAFASGSYRLWVNKCTTCEWEPLGLYRNYSDCVSAAQKLPNWYFWECNPA